MSIDFVDPDADCVLLRIVLWDASPFAGSLARYLRSSGRPFVRRPAGTLRPPTGAEGMVAFELFVLPINIQQLARLLNRGTSSAIGNIVCADDLPMFSLFRRRPPRNPNEPHREFVPYLNVLPQWQEGEEPEGVIPHPRTSSASP
jgi:hypothetical protein